MCGLLLLVVESQVLEVKRSVLGTGVFMLAAPVNANIPSAPSRSPEGTTQFKKKKKVFMIINKIAILYIFLKADLLSRV